jgi:tRNA(fMet)-specific endonuclease VapC
VKFMLDANAAIYLMNGLNTHLTARVSSCDTGSIVMSVIAFAEVAMGAEKSKPPPMGLLNAFLSEVPLLPFDEAAARAYAKLPFKRARFGRLLAAHALSLDLTVITADESGFADIPGLKVENWTLPLS